MAKVGCECGYVFHLSQLSDAEFSLVPESNIEELIEKSSGPLSPDEAIEIVDRNARHVLICPECGCVLIERKDGRGAYDGYRRTP